MIGKPVEAHPTDHALKNTSAHKDRTFYDFCIKIHILGFNNCQKLHLQSLKAMKDPEKLKFKKIKS